MTFHRSERILFFLANRALERFFKLTSASLRFHNDLVLLEELIDVQAQLVAKLVKSQLHWLIRGKLVALEAA